MSLGPWLKCQPGALEDGERALKREGLVVGSWSGGGGWGAQEGVLGFQPSLFPGCCDVGSPACMLPVIGFCLTPGPVSQAKQQ